MPTRPGAERELRVLLTTDVVGGVWDFCWVLAEELSRRGHSVVLLALGTPSPHQRAQAEASGATLLSAPLKLEWMQDSAADVAETVDLVRRLVRDLDVDVVHANQYALGAAELGAPVVLTAHSDVLAWHKWNRLAPGPEWGPYRELVRRGMERAHAAVAISRFVADEMVELYRLGRRPDVIHNGWPAPETPPPPLGGRAALTIVAGRIWDSAKNVAFALDAAGAGDLGRVALIGEPSHPESGTAPELGGPVERLGWLPRPEVDACLERARVYLAPARYEPFGLLPLQAALRGCALLLSDIPSFRELWDDAALFFRNDDPAALRRQWRRLLDDEPLAVRLSARASARAREHYSADRQAERYLALYHQLAAVPA